MNLEVFNLLFDLLYKIILIPAAVYGLMFLMSDIEQKATKRKAKREAFKRFKELYENGGDNNV